MVQDCVKYFKKSMPQMLQLMTRKAVSRAIRAHMIVDTALNTLLVSEAFPRMKMDLLIAPVMKLVTCLMLS